MSIDIAPATPSIAPGTTVQLRAFGVYSNNVRQDITTLVVWTSANSGVAIVNAQGLVTAIAQGSSTITAGFQNFSDSTVLTSSALLSISLSPAGPTIAAGTTVQFSALGELLNSATQDITSFVTWSSSDTGIASINSSGLATAATASTGSTTITASFNTVSGTTRLTSATVTSISVTPTNATIALGTSQQFAAAAALTGGATQNITGFAVWSSSTPSVATIGNAAGSHGLAVSVSAGSTLITASFSGVPSNPATLTVSPANLISISITPSSASVAVGRAQQFTAMGSYSDGTTKDITASATWTSSNLQAATVSNASETMGLATALSIGTTAVTASFSGVTSNIATLTVTAATLVSITVTPSNPNPNITIGTNLQFRALGTFSDNTAQDLTATVTWTSSNTAVAVISMTPGSQGFATAIGVGTTTITATSGNISGNTILTVTFFLTTHGSQQVRQS